MTIGGIGRLQGPIIGTVLFVALRKAFTDLGAIDLLMLGAAKVAAMLKAPTGFGGLSPAASVGNCPPWSGAFDFRSN